MTKLVLYTEGNVISTRKNGLFDLENRLKVIFNLLRKATSIEKSYKLNPFKKVVFSFIMAASFFGSIHLANERYVEYKKNPKNIIQYNQNIFRNEEEESCNIKTELNYPMFTNVNQKDCNISPCFVKGFHYGNFKINSLGFKGEEISKTKGKNIFRIVFLGGSTTFGMMSVKEKCNVDYPGVLNNLLNDYADSTAKHTKFEVINAGTPSVDSGYLLELLKQDVLPLNPDLVIYGPEWNDALSCSTLRYLNGNANATLKRYFSDLASEKDVIKLGPWFEKHIDTFRKNKRHNKMLMIIRSYEDAKNRLLKRLPILGILSESDSPHSEESLRKRDLHKHPIGQDSYLDDYDPQYSMQNFTKIIELSKENRVKYVGLSTIPDDFDDYYYAGLPTSCYLFYELNDLVRYNRKVLNPRIRKLAKKLDAILIDLEHEFNKLPDKRPLFSSEYMHCSKKGLKLEARIYFDSLLPYIKDLP